MWNKLNEKGITNIHNGDFQTAEIEFSEALSNQPDSPQVLFNLGIVYHKKGEFNDAEVAYLKALNGISRNNQYKVQYQLGNTLLAQNQYDKAISELDSK